MKPGRRAAPRVRLSCHGGGGRADEPSEPLVFNPDRAIAPRSLPSRARLSAVSDQKEDTFLGLLSREDRGGGRCGVPEAFRSVGRSCKAEDERAGPRGGSHVTKRRQFLLAAYSGTTPRGGAAGAATCPQAPLSGAVLGILPPRS